MIPDDRIMLGATGTVISAIGAGMSVTELQAIVSIIVTVAGFIISVLIPLIVKIINKIKAARADGVITKEEIDDIASTVKEVIDESSKVIEEIKDKKD